MTTVLPAWKLELIEKKKRKEQDHRQKVEQEKSRKVSIPEWKRSLLEKRKEAASDSPETKEHGMSVNSVFGPRIIRKTSQLNLPVANSSQKPAVRGDYEESKTNILQDVNTVRGGSLSSSPADANSCVTKAVEIPTEVEHKSNKLSTRKEIEDNRESSRQSDVAALREESNVALDIQQSETKLDNKHSAKTPSVFSYRRMFEQSETESKETSEPCIIKNTQSKTQVENHKSTTESTLRAVRSESNPSSSQLQISNKSSAGKAHSIHSEKSTRSHPDSNQQNVFTPKPTFAPKPYKSFVTTPPWLKNTSPKNITFQIGRNSVQEDVVVANVNTEVQSAPKNFDTSEKKSYVIESGAKEIITKTIESDDKQKVSFSNGNDPIPSGDVLQKEESVKKTTEETVLPSEKTVQKYSVIKETDSKEEQLTSKSDKGSESLKYIVIDGRNQEEPTSTIEKNKTSVSATSDSVSQVPNESTQHEEGENIPHPSSIESLRSKFGSIGGYRRWTSSEENIFLKGSQAEQSDQVVVIHRSSELKRPPPPTKRWSADILSLTSHSTDNSETSNLSPTSETKNIPSTANQLKRPPPPVKRWTADVINVMPRQTDDMSDLSPRSDSGKNSMISPSNSLSRGRSSSLCDIREETGLDYFQHKSNVAQGIEHRVNKLIRKMSVSETQLSVDDEESDSTSDDDPLSDLDLKLAANKEKDVPAPPQDVQPVFARKHSVSSEIEHRVTELFHRQLSQQSDADADESEGEKSSESDANITVVQVVDDVKEPNLKTESLPVVSTKLAIDFDSAPVKDDCNEESGHIVPESKPVSGSVHKLSALFGSSILKPKKKDKSVNEEKTKDKASKSSKFHSSDRSNQKGSSGDDGKKSTLFSKSQKSEGKSAQKDKQQSNTSIFPWLRKNDKKESIGGNKTKELLDKNQKNSSSSSPNEGTDTVSIAAFGLQPVHKPVKVEQRLFGNVKIISNASHEQTPPKGVYHKTKPSVQILEPEKEKIPSKKANESKTDNKGTESQVPAIVTQYWNGNEESRSSETSVTESVPITSIDEVPVSAIDMPESGDNDVTVSVIDVPASPDNRSAGKFAFFNGHKEDIPNPDDDNDVSVSVIDLPSPGSEKISAFQDGYLEADELSDGSDTDEVEGSYNFATGEITHVVNGDITQDDEDDEDDDDDEDEDDDYDDEDVPISYIGSAPQFPVPYVVFDSEPVQLKSCLSPKIERKKMNKGKVSFKSSHTVHDYPSEETVTAAYDEYHKDNNVQLKTLQNYQPAGLVNMEKNLARVGGHEQRSITPSAPVTNGDKNSHDMPASKSLPEIKYADEGQGFTDATDNASALLF
ncbi:dentin sialophosphoprotein-like [Orbicella faveolata]|uniref:dentin sialophosphoprotein-like n=1 Tax=Orbicella faveolata TaxID=48498 RepID=UPI0009E1FE8D|nr:dentin sialophosphoprotein-like [Orbicella faveolata]